MVIPNKKIVVFNLDGTIANIEHRVHFIQGEKKDWVSFFSACIHDKPIPWMIEIMRCFDQLNYMIYIVTGRSSIVEAETRNWLIENDVPCDSFIMRNQGDFRHDVLVKPELIADLKDRIFFIVEDRNSMVNKWRELGYNVLQCADGDF